MIHSYIKKPIRIEAILWTGENADELYAFTGKDTVVSLYANHESERHLSDVVIHTMEGDMRAKPGDYIIRGVHGEYYPCNGKIFEETYQCVDVTYSVCH